MDNKGPDFTDDDRKLHRRVYDAFKNKDGVEGEVISSIRDEVVAGHIKASMFIMAFSEILEMHGYGRDSGGWLVFNEILEDQDDMKHTNDKGSKNRKYLWKHLAFISMRWSPEICSDYGWNDGKLSFSKARLLYYCAQKYPRFKEDFIPHINLMQWLQKCADVENLDSVPSQCSSEDGDFKGKHLRLLRGLHRTWPTAAFGVA